MLTAIHPDRYNPWAHAAELDLTITYDDLPRPLRGLWHATTSTIVLHTGLGQAERRCVLAHELVHFERNDDGQCASDWHLDRLEQLVDAEAARRLIWLPDLSLAMILSDHERDWADELWVDLRTVRTRLGNLTETEHRRLQEMRSQVVYRLRTA